VDKLRRKEDANDDLSNTVNIIPEAFSAPVWLNSKFKLKKGGEIDFILLHLMVVFL
jgi:hypothetical protein